MPQALQQAVRLHQQGRLADAERLYRAALRAKNRDFDALHMLGILKLQQDEPAEAARLFAVAIEVDRRSAAAQSNYGMALAALGRHEEALAHYDVALALETRNAETLSNRGDTLCDLGRTDEALVSYDRALAIEPRLLSALVNRGVLLRDLGSAAEALASYDRALAIDANDADAWNNRGVVLHDLGRETEALASYDRALMLRPDFASALLNRGNVLLELKRPAEAIPVYHRALALDSRNAAAHDCCGHALFDLGRFEEALASYEKALALKPDYFDAAIHRSRTLVKLDRHKEAIAEYERLRVGEPEIPRLLGDLAYCKAAACDWSDDAWLAMELTAHSVDGTIDPFLFLGFDGSAKHQLACAQHWLRRKKIVGVERTWNKPDFAGEKIRIAYLSADFHRHATSHLIAELLEIHDRGRFEIVGISFGPDDGSALRSRVMKSFDRFFDVRVRTDHDVANMLRDLKIGIAVDLKGHTTDARIGILAQRVAPLQVSYLGYPGSTGADFIDYVIGDKTVLADDQQAFFTEKFVHLPDSYQVNDSKRPVAPSQPTRSAVGLPDNAFVFCCFNNSWKINAPIFDLWMRLLQKVDGSVLWLFQANTQAANNLRKEVELRGIAPGRLVFAPPLDLPDHLARHQLADLFLDTLPYNAHTTASDSLWSGVPVVTCLGDSFAGRVAASLLYAIGLPELVTANLSEYEALAFRLATDAEFLQRIKHRLAQNRLTHALFDTDRFRRHIEQAYRTMWEMWLRDETPRGFSIVPIER